MFGSVWAGLPYCTALVVLQERTLRGPDNEKVSLGHSRILGVEILSRSLEYTHGRRRSSWDGGKVLQI